MDKVKNNGVELSYRTETTYHTSIVINSIDVDDGIDTVEFLVDVENNYLNSSPRRVCLRNVNKQFLDVKTLIIPQNVEDIDMSNFMFPNVEKIISYTSAFESDRNILIKKYLNLHQGTLLNTFCKKPDEVVDLTNVSEFRESCFDGCMSTNIINCKKISRLGEDVFKHYLPAKVGPFKNGVLAFGNILAGIDSSADVVELPSNISIAGYDSPKNIIKTMIVHSSKNFSALRIFYGVKINKLIIKDNDEIDFESWQNMNVRYAEIPEDNEMYSSKDGIIYNKSGDTLIRCPSNYYKEDLIIPEGVKVIEEEAFGRCKNLKSVTFPDSLKVICNSAFLRCEKLEKVNFGHGLVSIGSSAESSVFGFCNFKSLVIPNEIYGIGYTAFMNCSNLESVEIGEGVYFIEGMAFKGDKIKTLKIKSEKCRLANECLIGAEKIYVPEILPKRFFYAVLSNARNTNPAYIDDYFDIVEITDGKQSMFLPRYVNYEDIKVLDKMFYLRKFAEVISEKGFLASMYNYATTSETKQNLALTIYKYNGDEDMKAYLKRTAFSFAKRLLVERKDEQKLIEFLSLNLTTPTSLNKLLDIAKKESSKKDSGDMSSLIAYILKAIEDAGGSKKTFTL